MHVKVEMLQMLEWAGEIKRTRLASRTPLLHYAVRSSESPVLNYNLNMIPQEGKLQKSKKINKSDYNQPSVEYQD